MGILSKNNKKDSKNDEDSSSGNLHAFIDLLKTATDTIPFGIVCGNFGSSYGYDDDDERGDDDVIYK